MPRDWTRRAVGIGLGALPILIVAQVGLVILYSQAPADAGPPLAAGEFVEPLELRSLAGDPARLDYSHPEAETVLLVFSTACPACRSNMENWKELSGGPARDGRRFYYVSISSPDRTRAFVDPFDLDGPVLLGSPEELAPLRLSRIPVTVAIGPGGLVRGVWIGEVPARAFDAS